eukprot:CAMPEP_0118914912 /NCGR_PEP_ID=MMETSP1166-20130328/15197_1 /TAXON_ID=1104430 /ORGANISM="Chrysoreinhardia sp, Strain CCMP3193" /LENGTH=1170 /DNA_ID=CAMNT_0006854545 /DNA_START=197 /DNA_END=3709 /DNA_ORIENTATION=-
MHVGAKTAAPTSLASEMAGFRSQPIPLVEVGDDSKFHVNPEAWSIIGNLRGKICVITVAGLYRSGKSSLVNFLLSEVSEHRKGFTVGPSVRRCTRGIWFWGEPRRCTLPSGEPCWVITLDTEGLGGLEADKHYDTRIFSLATLLCSTLVYNSLGSIDESAISNLSFVANLSSHIRISDHGKQSSTTATDRASSAVPSARGDDVDAHEFHKFFPSFVWVVRDFALDLVDDDDNAISADEYLEKSLRVQVGFDAATTERNRIRSMLTSFFTNRACFPLVRPLGDESRLQQIDAVPFDELRPEFQVGVRSLKLHLYETHLRPKEIHGRPLSGASFLAMTEQYVNAIERGSVPTITTAWEEVMAQECKAAMHAAIMAYIRAVDDELRDYTACSTDRLYRAHLRGLQTAVTNFESRAAGDAVPGFRRALEDDIDAKLEDRLCANVAKSHDLCRDLIKRLHTAIIAQNMTQRSHFGDLVDENDVDDDGTNITGSYTDVASLKFDVQTVVSRYAAAAVGPAKDTVLCDYVLTEVLDSAQWLFEKISDTYENAVAKLEADVSEAAGERAKLAAREKVVQDALQAQQKELIAVSSQKTQLETQAKVMEGRVSSLFGELQRANRRKEELEQDLEDVKEALDSEQTWQAELHQRLEDMEAKSMHRESKLGELGKLLDQHKLEASEKHAQLEKQREVERTMAQRLAEFEVKHAKTVDAHEVAKLEVAKIARDRDALMKRNEREAEERQKIAAKCDELSLLLSAANDNHIKLEAKLQEAQSRHGTSTRELEAALQAAKEDVNIAHAHIDDLTTAVQDSNRTVTARNVTLDEKSQLLDKLRTELEGVQARHAELLRAHSQLSTEYRAFQQKMNQRVTYLKSQLDEHQSTSSTTSTELQRKAARENELEKRLEIEINLRASLQSEKDSQVFDLQKKLAEASTRLRQSETRTAHLKTALEAAQNDLNQVAAQRAVLLDEKDKMQALWEKSLADHFNSLHVAQSELEQTKGKMKNSDTATAGKMTELEAKLEEYRRIVERVQTRKEGLLRKRTRSRLVKQTWHVKLFRLVGNSLLHRDTDNAGTGEKTFILDAVSQYEILNDGKSDDRGTSAAQGKFLRNSFKVSSGEEELILAAIDRADMQEWVDAISGVILDLENHEKRTAETKRRFLQEPTRDGNVSEDPDYAP